MQVGESTEDQQQQLDDNSSTCRDLSDDHRMKNSSTEEAVGNPTAELERKAAGVGRGAQRRCNSSASRHLTTSRRAALKEEAEDSIIMGDDDTTESHHEESHGCLAQPPADDEAYHTRISNHVAELTSQSCEDDDGSNGGKDNHGNDHDTDHSHDEAYEDANNSFLPHTPTDTMGPTSTNSTFPQHLMDVIEQSQHDEPNILEWVNGGGAFLIRDKEAFEQNILVPKYFNRGRNKCKFMSFVRKLYRWGFRQVDKSLPGGSTAASLTFMHPNFIRGDKQRCLLMRSIVKKPVRTSSLRQSSAHQHGEAALDRAAAIPLHLTHHPTTIQTFGPSVRRLGQLQQSVSSPGIAQQASTGTAIHPLSLSVQNLAYQGRPPTLQISTTAIPDRFSSAIASSAPTSSSTSMQHHSAGILKRLLVQQRQDELVRHIRDRINDGIMAISMSRPTELALPPFDQPRMMQPVQPAAVLGSPARAPSFGHHHANDFGRRLNSGYMNVAAAGSDTPEVAVLAAQIMKSNPGIAPSRAFELAKKAFTRA